jgi:hypothetical protein
VAELEVLSGGKNVASGATATQSSASRGPELAVDGKGDTFSLTRTHTGAGDDVAWLEVDLGAERPIEAVVVWPRTGRRSQPINGFTLKVLDGKRHVTFIREDNTASADNLRIGVGDVSGDVRRAAIRAAASISKDAPRTFGALAGLIERGEQVPTAAAGLRALPRNAWNTSRAPAMADALLAWAASVPADQRTSSDYCRPCSSPSRSSRSCRRTVRRRPCDVAAAARAVLRRRHGARADALRRDAPDRRAGQAVRDPV